MSPTMKEVYIDIQHPLIDKKKKKKWVAKVR
jgi:hypothetical protein